MNRRKVAVFVEGQSEYIFVRDFLCGWYNYDSSLLGIECFSLRSDRFHSVPYPFGDRESYNYYQIVNVGNDRSVLSKMQTMNCSYRDRYKQNYMARPYPHTPISVRNSHG